MLGEACNAETRRQVDVRAHASFESMTCYSLTYPFGHVKRAFGGGFGQHQYEFVPAVAGDEIRISHCLGYHLSDLSQRRASRAMTVGVVDRLEPIKVHKNHRDGRAIAT